MSNLLIIDGPYLLRAIYHSKKMKQTPDSKGYYYTHATAFFSCIDHMCSKFKITHLTICWDSQENFRYKLQSSYKGSRKPAPVPFVIQRNQVIQVLKDEPNSLMIEGYEADDIVASICQQHHRDFNKILIFSGDADLKACLYENVFIINRIKNPVFVGASDLKLETGIASPNEFRIYKRMSRDTSDKINGKMWATKDFARQLIAVFGSLQQTIDYVRDTPDDIGCSYFIENNLKAKDFNNLKSSLRYFEKQGQITDLVCDLQVPKPQEMKYNANITRCKNKDIFLSSYTTDAQSLISKATVVYEQKVHEKLQIRKSNLFKVEISMAYTRAKIEDKIRAKGIYTLEQVNAMTEERVGVLRARNARRRKRAKENAKNKKLI